MAGFTKKPTEWPRNFRPNPGDFGALFNTLARAIGTGGQALTGTATTTVWVGIPAARTFSVESAGMIGNIPADGSSTITAVLLGQRSAASTLVTLTAATSIKSDIITGSNVNVFDWPVTATGATRTFSPGDSLRWEIVAAATAATAPVLQAVVEIAIQS